MKFYVRLAAFAELLFAANFLFWQLIPSRDTPAVTRDVIDKVWLAVGPIVAVIAVGIFFRHKVARVGGILAALAYLVIGSLNVYEYGGTFGGGGQAIVLFVIVYTMLIQLFVAGVLIFAWGERNSQAGARGSP
ncbi:MAG TPA: hypothetical protein VKY85_01070 [Candidatus Angelobacter sp.]|nr:hypothetical protein [Candidatus Angelobacter sp.]